MNYDVGKQSAGEKRSAKGWRARWHSTYREGGGGGRGCGSGEAFSKHPFIYLCFYQAPLLEPTQKHRKTSHTKHTHRDKPNRTWVPAGGALLGRQTDRTRVSAGAGTGTGPEGRR